MTIQRRTLLLAAGAAALVPLAGCMTKPLRPVNADGTYCHRTGKSYRPTLTCTPTAVPTDAQEAEAKRFVADPGALTVYVLRNRWEDVGAVVPVVVNGGATVSTIPASLVRLRLKPGAHRLSAQWDGRDLDIAVAGQAGDQRFIELAGSGWTWGSRFRFDLLPTDSALSLARAAKFVADLDLRR